MEDPAGVRRVPENVHLRNWSPCQWFNCQIIDSDSDLFIAGLRQHELEERAKVLDLDKPGVQAQPCICLVSDPIEHWSPPNICFLICQRRSKLFYVIGDIEKLYLNHTNTAQQWDVIIMAKQSDFTILTCYAYYAIGYAILSMNYGSKHFLYCIGHISLVFIGIVMLFKYTYM